MLPKQNRLRKGEVEFLLKKGRKFRYGDFFIILRKNQARLNRFCIIIGKKLKLKSSERTGLRRRIYEAIRKNQSAMQCENATFDAALGPSDKIKHKSFSEIEQEITHILKNLDKWAKTS